MSTLYKERERERYLENMQCVCIVYINIIYGYIVNPYVKFGANCYGIKPPKPDGWSPSASFEECEVNPVDEEMEKLKNMAKINNFNQKKWSRY